MSLCFTVIIKGINNSQIPYVLAYEPCPQWKYGDNFIINMNPEDPHYKKGSFKQLLEYHENTVGTEIHPDKKCLIVCNKDWESSGYDDSNTLNRLREDIESEDFNVGIFQF